MSEALTVPVVIISKMYWVCIVFIFMNILGTDFRKKKKMVVLRQKHYTYRVLKCLWHWHLFYH